MPEHPLTLYWHDYETFGADPVRDRPAQFAGQRTDADLNPVGEPLVVYCRPSPDRLPAPEACLITGITPQLALAKGLNEAGFIGRIHEELARPGTCGVGYNNLRFDDEVTRHTLYRNFFDAYAREWQNGNSRWDLIDVARMCYALRPDGIEWPRHEDGNPSFRLEDLSAANGLEHDSAHDALSDVHATIGLARLIKKAQPRLYDFAFSMRRKQTALGLLNVRDKQPVVHTSAMYPAQTGCTTVVVPVALHPVNKNAVIVYDLRYDPAELIGADPEQIAERLFTKNDDLPEGVDRFPLKSVHINKSPMLAPLNTLNDAAAARLQLDMVRVKQHLETIRGAGELETRIQQALKNGGFQSDADPELNLYGGFVNDADRDRMAQVRRSKPEALAELRPAFDDARLPELLFRYRARNWPQTLNSDEQARWLEHCRAAVSEGRLSLSMREYEQRLQALADGAALNEAQMEILEALAEYGAELQTMLEG
jgi:exodeoxyribonuclease-1